MLKKMFKVGPLEKRLTKIPEARPFIMPGITTRADMAAVKQLYDIIDEQKEKIAELESLLKASRRVSLCAMQMLARKNKINQKVV